jgi:hypothetical protein
MARRTTVELDEKKFSRVRRVLGTRGIKETIDRAFDETSPRSSASVIPSDSSGRRL